MKRILIISILAAAIAGCGKRQAVVYYDGFAEGTTYHFALKTSDTTGLQREIDSIFYVVEKSMSIYDTASLINKLNVNATDSLDNMIADCIALASRVSRESNGIYDITIMPLTMAWGFARKSPHGKPDIDSLMQFIGYEKISIENGRLMKSDPRVMIDLNSTAKGYSVDLIASHMRRRNIQEFLIEVGGEIYARGTNAKGEPWKIGIDKPADGNFIPGEELQTVIRLSDMALATSGNYRKFRTDEDGNKIVHTINPKTGEATASNLLSATVIAATCAEADAYGTMLMAMGLDEAKKFLEKREDITAYLIFSDEKGNFASYATPGLEKLEFI